MRNVMKKVTRRAEKFFMNGKRQIRILCTSMALAYMMLPSYASAATGYALPLATSYTTPLTKLKTVLITIAAAVGAVMLIYGGIRFAIAFQKMDQNGEHSAVYTLVAAGVLIGISAVVAALT